LNRTDSMAVELLFKEGSIRRLSDSEYLVRSTDGKTWFTTSWKGKSWRCDCQDPSASHKACEHVRAVSLLLHLPQILALATDPQLLICPSCGADPDKLKKSGVQRNKSGPTQRYVCTQCSYRFNDRSSFQRLRSNPMLILIAVDLYFKGLSSRQTSEHLSEFYGCNVSHVTVYRWVRRYSKLMKESEAELAAKLNLGKNWHADETLVRVKGNLRYIWNILDSRTRYLLASQVTARRDAKTFRRIFRNVMDEASMVPKRVTTDGLQTYRNVMRDYKDIEHVAGRSFKDPNNNNLIERANKTLKVRLKAMEKFGSEEGAKSLADGLRIYYNFVRPHAALGGRTPAEAAGIAYGAKNKLLSAIRGTVRLPRTA
jgi:putative transposase